MWSLFIYPLWMWWTLVQLSRSDPMGTWNFCKLIQREIYFILAFRSEMPNTAKHFLQEYSLNWASVRMSRSDPITIRSYSRLLVSRWAVIYVKLIKKVWKYLYLRNTCSILRLRMQNVEVAFNLFSQNYSSGWYDNFTELRGFWQLNWQFNWQFNKQQI